LKIFRKLEAGIQPDIEVSRFLSERAGFANTPPFAGWLEYRRRGRRAVAIGTVQAFVPNRGDAWATALALVTRYFDRLRTRHATRPRQPSPSTPFAVARDGVFPIPSRLIGRDALAMASRLGTRTGELHRALASDRLDPAFTPVPSTSAYQRALVREQLARANTAFRLLHRAMTQLPASARKEAETVVRLRSECLARIRQIESGRVPAQRIRCHGDYHLGQVLDTGRDFMIIDFEGEPAKPLRARREKHPPFRDAAGMMRSFHYAAYAGLFKAAEHHAPAASLRAWAEAWYSAMAGAFLRAYLAALAGSGLLPADPAVTARWLRTFYLDKALYEVAYELNNRPAWVRIPLSGIQQALAGEPAPARQVTSTTRTG
jgi:maltose alpha-D-glucosyltransferase/alpha-amylase